MRAVFAVALCFVLGACATFGGGGPDIYGVYDLETSADVDVWIGLGVDGSFELSVSGPSVPEEEYYAGGFSILDENDDCVLINYWAEVTGGEPVQASICGNVLTNMEDNQVFHKRR